MAKKKRTNKSAVKTVAKAEVKPPVETEAKPVSVAPSLPSYEELLTARHYRDEMHACVRQAERQLRSARTINTFSIRDEKVAAATEQLMECRSDAAEATFKFEDMKRKAKG